jgi:hypothetical protein
MLPATALIVGQRDGDGIFIVANKPVVAASDFTGERLSRAPHRNPSNTPYDIDRTRRHAVKFGNVRWMAFR